MYYRKKSCRGLPRRDFAEEGGNDESTLLKGEGDIETGEEDGNPRIPLV